MLGKYDKSAVISWLAGLAGCSIGIGPGVLALQILLWNAPFQCEKHQPICVLEICKQFEHALNIGWVHAVVVARVDAICLSAQHYGPWCKTESVQRSDRHPWWLVEGCELGQTLSLPPRLGLLRQAKWILQGTDWQSNNCLQAFRPCFQYTQSIPAGAHKLVLTG